MLIKNLAIFFSTGLSVSILTILSGSPPSTQIPCLVLNEELMAMLPDVMLLALQVMSPLGSERFSVDITC